MKKIFLSFMVLLASISSHTQNPYTDSLKGRLTAAKDPLEKFSLLNKISEGLFSGNSQKVDSAVCLQMLEIAQDLRNDSLLAIVMIGWGIIFRGPAILIQHLNIF